MRSLQAHSLRHAPGQDPGAVADILVRSRWLRVLHSGACWTGWPALVALAADFGLALAAAHRYERLRHAACGRVEPNAARRVFAEYYAQPGEHSDRRMRDRAEPPSRG